MIWNRPRQPRDNAMVERSQGVSQQWVEAHTCADAKELQERLDRMDRVQRDPGNYGVRRRRLDAVRVGDGWHTKRDDAGAWTSGSR